MLSKFNRCFATPGSHQLQGDEDGLSGTIMDQAQTSDRLYDADLELV